MTVREAWREIANQIAKDGGWLCVEIADLSMKGRITRRQEETMMGTIKTLRNKLAVELQRRGRIGDSGSTYAVWGQRDSDRVRFARLAARGRAGSYTFPDRRFMVGY